MLNTNHLLSLASMSQEEKQQYLNNLKKSLDPVVVKSVMQKISDAKSKRDVTKPDAIDQTPDINTCFSPGCAIAINSETEKEIYYWYTFNGSQKWYYKYTIPALNSTWNWAWSDSYTHHSLVIEIPQTTTESTYYVLVFQAYANIELSQLIVLDLYITTSTPGHTPLFTDKVWWYIDTIIPNIDTFDIVWNYHMTLRVQDDRIIWE